MCKNSNAVYFTRMYKLKMNKRYECAMCGQVCTSTWRESGTKKDSQVDRCATELLNRCVENKMVKIRNDRMNENCYIYIHTTIRPANRAHTHIASVSSAHTIYLALYLLYVFTCTQILPCNCLLGGSKLYNSESCCETRFLVGGM